MKSKDYIVKTKDEREAEELLSKLTNKEKANFTEFWKKHENQMRLNKVAIPEFLKQAVRENNMEMFDFLWDKSKEKNTSLGRFLNPLKGKKKSVKRDFGKELGLVGDLVLVAVVSNNSKFIDYLGKKIGYKSVINGGTAFKTMLEDGKTDMFKSLYQKAEDLLDKEQAIELAAKKNNVSALEFCIEKETVNGELNKKLEKAWERAIESLIRVDNEEMALKIYEKVKNVLPKNENEKIINIATRYNKNNLALKCLENISRDERISYSKIFENAVLANNKQMIEKIGPVIKNDKRLVQHAVFMKRYQNNEEILKTIIRSTKLKEKEIQELEDNYMIAVATGTFLKDNIMPKGGDEFILMRNAINAEKLKLQDIELMKHSPSKNTWFKNMQIKLSTNKKVRLKKLTRERIKELRENKDLIQIVPNSLRKNKPISNKEMIARLKANKDLISVQPIDKSNLLSNEEFEEITRQLDKPIEQDKKQEVKLERKNKKELPKKEINRVL